MAAKRRESNLDATTASLWKSAGCFVELVDYFGKSLRHNTSLFKRKPVRIPAVAVLSRARTVR